MLLLAFTCQSGGEGALEQATNEAHSGIDNQRAPASNVAFAAAKSVAHGWAGARTPPIGLCRSASVDALRGARAESAARGEGEFGAGVFI
ncbi:MAG: hypothetical protein ACI83N_000504 [Hydrogenophaga sp.]|jgi:hypothetical protein